MERSEPDYAFDTIAVHAGAEPDPLTGALAPPIYQTSTYAQDGVGRPRDGYEYARAQNPTRERLERAVAALEAGRHGIAFASGSAATAALAELAAPGDEMIVGDDVTAARIAISNVFTARRASKRAMSISRRGPTSSTRPSTSGRASSGSRRPPTRCSRSSTSPRSRVVGAAFAGGGRPRIVVDNTFASPALQRPLELGADITFHSSTKYLAGHSDTLGGIVVTNDDAIAERLRFLQNAMGAVPGPLDCFLVLRGLRTLHLRMERHTANGAAVAAFLRSRDDLEHVAYPGSGGMVSFVPRPGGPHGRDARERAIAICEGVRLFTLAESLGGVDR